MKKKKQIISAFTAAVCIVMLSLTQAAATPDLTFHGQINWTDEPDTDTLRPESVAVYLLADGEQIAQTETSAKEDWQFSFVASPETAAASTYTYSADQVPGYEEDTTASVDPKIETVPAEIGTWEKYEPCNSLTISQDLLSDMLIAGKMTRHQPLVIWSREDLSAAEQESVEAAVRALPGVGNPPPAAFISGDGAEKYGMNISLADGTVNFEDPSQWALLFGSTYSNSRIEVGEGSLTLRWIPVLDPPANPAPIRPESVPIPPESAPIPPEENKPESMDSPKENEPAPAPGKAVPEDKPEIQRVSATVSGKITAVGGGAIVAAKTGMPADYYVSLYGFFCSLALITGLLIWKKNRKAA